MIQAIGVIIGFYVFTRMIEILSTRINEPGLSLLRIFAILTAVVAILCTILIIATGVKLPCLF